MTEQEYRFFCRKREQHFKSQRELPNGRNFMWSNSRYETENDRGRYRDNYDRIFRKEKPDAAQTD